MDARSGYSLLMSEKGVRWLKGALALAVLALIVLVALAAAGVFSHCVQAPSPLTVNVNFNASGHWPSTVRLESLEGQPRQTKVSAWRLEGPSKMYPGFDEVPGVGHYKFVLERVTWEDAKAACEAENAHLVILNSQAEATAVEKLLQKTSDPTGDWHAGFHDKTDEGSHITILGQPLDETGYTEWCEDEPNNYDDHENCGDIRASNMCLNDIPCSTKLPFVCEIS